MKRRVVVTGLGVVTSLDCKPDSLFDRLAEGESSIHPLKLFCTKGFKVNFGGDIYDWNPDTCISFKQLKRVDRFSQFAIVAGTDAVVDSGIDFESEDVSRSGVILGSGVGGISEIESQVEQFLSKGPDRVSALSIPKLMLNSASGNLSIKYGIRGPSYAVATACASATNAIGEAFKAIQYGTLDLVITGGAEAAITPTILSSFTRMRALSERSDDPIRASRPFDRDRNGFVLSEGAGLLVLEELEHAKMRKAKIHAELLGYGTSSDAEHITQPSANGVGASLAMSNALRDAQVTPEHIDYINAHGTGTPLGDKAETIAIKTTFGEHARRVSISSTKSQLGHALGASGGIELIVTVRALQKAIIPPTINLDSADPDCDLDYTPLVARERSMRLAMSNSFGFGGHNASLVVGKYLG